MKDFFNKILCLHSIGFFCYFDKGRLIFFVQLVPVRQAYLPQVLCLKPVVAVGDFCRIDVDEQLRYARLKDNPQRFYRPLFRGNVIDGVVWVKFSFVVYGGKAGSDIRD